MAGVRSDLSRQLVDYQMLQQSTATEIADLKAQLAAVIPTPTSGGAGGNGSGSPVRARKSTKEVKAVDNTKSATSPTTTQPPVAKGYPQSVLFIGMFAALVIGMLIAFLLKL